MDSYDLQAAKRRHAKIGVAGAAAAGTSASPPWTVESGPPPFPEYGDGRTPFTPSTKAQWLRGQWLEFMRPALDFMHRHMTTLGGRYNARSLCQMNN